MWLHPGKSHFDQERQVIGGDAGKLGRPDFRAQNFHGRADENVIEPKQGEAAGKRPLAAGVNPPLGVRQPRANQTVRPRSRNGIQVPAKQSWFLETGIAEPLVTQ
jgi:hypothetical protein